MMEKQIQNDSIQIVDKVMKNDKFSINDEYQ